jgi:hypothetical protein
VENEYFPIDSILAENQVSIPIARRYVLTLRYREFNVLSSRTSPRWAISEEGQNAMGSLIFWLSLRF